MELLPYTSRCQETHLTAVPTVTWFPDQWKLQVIDHNYCLTDVGHLKLT